MSDTIWGVVRDGKIIPQSPLPDGLHVQITVPEGGLIPEELQSEPDAWSQGNADALAMVEKLAEEMAARDQGCAHLGIAGRSRLLQKHVLMRRCRRGLCPPISWLRLHRVVIGT